MKQIHTFRSEASLPNFWGRRRTKSHWTARRQSKYFELNFNSNEINSWRYSILQQIYDSYYWLEEDSERRDRILPFEEYTLQKYLHLNAHKNEWYKVRQMFYKSTDYKLFSDVQYRNWWMFYNYMDFSSGIYKPLVDKFVFPNLSNIDAFLQFTEFSIEQDHWRALIPMLCSTQIKLQAQFFTTNTHRTENIVPLLLANRISHCSFTS